MKQILPRYYTDKYVSWISWKIMNTDGHKYMEIFEEEVEMYNSKLRLMSWLYDELRLHPDILKDKINEKGQKLPLNL